MQTNFGDAWWTAKSLLDLREFDRQRDIKVVVDRLNRQGVPVDIDQIVANLTFGFWVGMLDDKYNPVLWASGLKSAFPNLPADVTRASFQQLCRDVLRLRNRVFHHEPLVKVDVLAGHGTVMRLLRWICPDTERRIRPHCDVPSLARAKP